MTTNTEALLPCPFCGTQPDEHDISDYAVECPSCGIHGPERVGAQRAIETWNTRATHPAPTQPEQDKGGEPVAWRWFNSNGDQVTNWLDFKPSQRGSIESQVSEAGGHVEYAYARAALRPAQAGVQTGWMKAPGITADSGEVQA